LNKYLITDVTQNADDESLAARQAGGNHGGCPYKKYRFCKGCAPVPALTESIAGILSE
jgi:hypothetical protein